jgi:hypothetical protein
VRGDRAEGDALGEERDADVLTSSLEVVTASSRRPRSSWVISSASISFRPRPKRWGASRQSGRVNTFPPNPRSRTAGRGRRRSCRRVPRRTRPRPRCCRRRRRRAARAPLRDPVLALEELPPALDRAEGIALDQEDGGVRRHGIPASGPDLLEQGFLDPGVQRVRRLRDVGELGLGAGGEEDREGDEDGRSDDSVRSEDLHGLRRATSRANRPDSSGKFRGIQRQRSACGR